MSIVSHLQIIVRWI